MLRRRVTSRRLLLVRRGFTLLETTLVLVLTALVVGIISAVGIKLQRQLGETQTRVAVGEELATAAAIVPLDLRSLSPSAGDIRAGEARDTSVEFRAAIATGVVCSAQSTTLVVAPYLIAGGRRASPSIQTGDTVWLLADADSAEGWRPAAIRSVRSLGGACSRVTDDAGRTVFDLQHLLALELRDSIADTSALVARITRPVRYSLYRAGDGLWYLGLRTWNTSLGQFNGVQPLAGPYAPPSLPFGSHIEYFDSAGRVVTPGALDTHGIARVEWVLRAAPRPSNKYATDSTRIVVAIRNRR